MTDPVFHPCPGIAHRHPCAGVTYRVNQGDAANQIIANTTSTDPGPNGQLDIYAPETGLWFARSGNDLVVDVLGPEKAATIKNWYATSTTNWQQLSEIVAGNYFETVETSFQNLIQAMATFAAATPRVQSADYDAYQPERQLPHRAVRQHRSGDCFERRLEGHRLTFPPIPCAALSLRAQVQQGAARAGGPGGEAAALAVDHHDLVIVVDLLCRPIGRQLPG